MIIRYLMSNERRMYISYAFSNLSTADLLSRLAAYTSHLISNPKCLKGINHLSDKEERFKFYNLRRAL